MSDLIDIEYKGKIKNTYMEDDVFDKIKKYIKRNKLDKVWDCETDKSCITIKFNDNKSDNFYIDIDNQKFSGYCRIDNDSSLGKSTLEKLIDMLFSIKSIFSKIELEDEYSLCKDIFKNKSLKIKLRELTEDELLRIKKICDNGCKDYKEFILTCIAQDLRVPSYKELYINPVIKEINIKAHINQDEIDFYNQIFETWLYETTEYKNEGRFCNTEFFDTNSIYYQELGSLGFDSYAFYNGMTNLIINSNEQRNFTMGVRDSNVKKLYKEKVYPMLQEEKDLYNQCVIVYRYFVSILDYTGFKFIGKE